MEGLTIRKTVEQTMNDVINMKSTRPNDWDDLEYMDKYKARVETYAKQIDKNDIESKETYEKILSIIDFHILDLEDIYLYPLYRPTEQERDNQEYEDHMNLKYGEH